MRPVLGIETSCDETAAAVVDGAGHILAEAVLSQLDDHAASSFPTWAGLPRRQGRG
jgi:tRNA A37 threonylcarbamoyltransferase TsaD